MKMTILCGIARSGKSTYIQNNIDDNTVVISRDSLREMLFLDKNNMKNEELVTSCFEKVLQEALKTGKDIVIDNTNLLSKYIAQFIDKAKHYNYKVKLVRFWVSPKILLKRAEESSFPKEVILRMLANNHLLDFELINGIEIEDIGMSGLYTVMDYFEDLDFDQHSKHHDATALIHSHRTVDVIQDNYYGLYKTELMTAALLHDIGKPYCIDSTVADNWTYKGHATVSSYIIMAHSTTIENKLVAVLSHLHMERFALRDLKGCFKFAIKLMKWQHILSKDFENLNLLNLLGELWKADELSHGENADTEYIEKILDKLKELCYN